MIAYGLSVVAHIVDDRSGEVLVGGHHVVRPIDAGLTLQDVTVVDEQQVVAVLRAFLFNICTGTGECSLERLALHKVVREEMSVYVAGLDHLETDGLRLLS